MVATVKQTYRIQLASGRPTLPLVTGIPNRADAEAVLRGIVKRMDFDPAALVIVGSTRPVAGEEEMTDGSD